MKKIINFLSDTFPKAQVGLYLITGVWNTVFGYAVYAIFVWLFSEKFPYSYMLAAVISNIFSVTQSFLTYKYIVFRTQGNFLKEYIKCWGVYGTASLISLALLPIPVIICEHLLPTSYKYLAPYIGGLILLGVTVIISFLGHKNITFKQCNRES